MSTRRAFFRSFLTDVIHGYDHEQTRGTLNGRMYRRYPCRTEGAPTLLCADPTLDAPALTRLGVTYVFELPPAELPQLGDALVPLGTRRIAVGVQDMPALPLPVHGAVCIDPTPEVFAHASWGVPTLYLFSPEAPALTATNPVAVLLAKPAGSDLFIGHVADWSRRPHSPAFERVARFCAADVL
jgi:hypothetical protein